MLYRFLADVEPTRNFFVAQPVSDLSKNLLLARRESGKRARLVALSSRSLIWACQQIGCQRGRHVRFATCNRANDADQFGPAHPFQDVAFGALLNSGADPLSI